MGSNAVLHVGYERDACRIEIQERRSNASSVSGMIPMTGASPLRARGDVMAKVAQVLPAAPSRKSAVRSNRAVDRSAVRAPVDRLASHHRPGLSPSRGQYRVKPGNFLAGRLLNPPLGQSLGSDRHSFGLPNPRHGGPLSVTGTPITWTITAICTKLMFRSWLLKRRRRAQGQPSAMRASLTGFRTMMAATSLHTGSMAQMTHSIILPRTGPRTEAVTVWSNRNGPTRKPQASMCRLR